MTPDATRRRAIGQILLLAAGFLVLVAISTASVLLVNKAREDNGLVVHTVEVENQINALLLDVRRAESNARGYLLTSRARVPAATTRPRVATILPDLDRLSQSTSDNPVQVENVKKLRLAIDTRLGQFAKAIGARQAGPARRRRDADARSGRRQYRRHHPRSRAHDAGRGRAAVRSCEPPMPTAASSSPRS